MSLLWGICIYYMATWTLWAKKQRAPIIVAHHNCEASRIPSCGVYLYLNHIDVEAIHTKGVVARPSINMDSGTGGWKGRVHDFILWLFIPTLLHVPK